MKKTKKEKKPRKIRKFYVFLTIFVIVTCTATIGGYVAYNYMGDYVFKELVESAGAGGEGDIDLSALDGTLGEGFLDEGETAEDKFESIDPQDRADAIMLLQSKFTAEEIAHYMAMVAEGKMNEVLPEVKQKLKERCTEEEIAQIRDWYDKYK